MAAFKNGNVTTSILIGLLLCVSSGTLITCDSSTKEASLAGDDLEILTEVLKTNGLSIRNFKPTDLDDITWDNAVYKKTGPSYRAAKGQILCLRIMDTPLKEIKGLNRLKHLVSLDVSHNLQLQTMDLSGLKDLKKCIMVKTAIRDLSHIKWPASLQSLRLSLNDHLKQVDQGDAELPVTLTLLDLSYNKNLEKANLKGLKNLKKLWLNNCSIKAFNRSMVPDGLIDLVLSENKALNELDLYFLWELKTLWIYDCGLEDQSALKLPQSLTELYMAGYPHFKAVDLSALKNLRRLVLNRLGIEDFSLSKIPLGITELNLFGNRHMARIDLSGYHVLRTLNLGDTGIKDVNQCRFPLGLTTLYLASCRNLSSLELAGLPNLVVISSPYGHYKTIKLHNLPRLKAMQLENGNKTLEELDLSGVPALETLDLKNCGISSLSGFKLPDGLKDLNLSGNEQLREIRLAGFPRLENLYLSDCLITHLSLSDLPQLRQLDLSMSSVSKKMPPEKQPELEQFYDVFFLELDLSGLTGLEKLIIKDFDREVALFLSREREGLVKIESKGTQIKEIIWKSGHDQSPGKGH